MIVKKYSTFFFVLLVGLTVLWTLFTGVSDGQTGKKMMTASVEMIDSWTEIKDGQSVHLELQKRNTSFSGHAERGSQFRNKAHHCSLNHLFPRPTKCADVMSNDMQNNCSFNCWEHLNF